MRQMYIMVKLYTMAKMLMTLIYAHCHNLPVI